MTKHQHGKNSSRRSFLKKLGAGASVAVASPYLSLRAHAQENVVTFCGWGGSFQDHLREAFLKPFEKDTGIKVLEATLPTLSKIKTMVDADNVTIDVFDTQGFVLITLGKLGYFEEIDYDMFDKANLANMIDGAQKKYGISNYSASECMAFRTDAFPGGSHPGNWAEFWDVEKFPGRRTMAGGERGIRPNLEFALLADGVPKDEIYPIDQDRAWKSLARMKDHVIKWWTDSGLSPQLLVTNEAVLATAFNGRVDTLKLQGQPIDIELNEAANRTNNWSIPKGTKYKENAMRLVASFSIPERQARLAELIAYGPTNRLAFKHLSVERAREMPSGPENEKRGFWVSDQWWADNGGDVATRWSKWILE